MDLFSNGINAIEGLPVLEDKLLFVRVGYNCALTHFYLANFREVMEIGYKLNHYSDFHKLIYLGGRINHLLGITCEKMNNLNEAEHYMSKATVIFKAESKQYYHLKAYRALAEIQLKMKRTNKGIESLHYVEDQLDQLSEPNNLKKLVESTKGKYSV